MRIEAYNQVQQAYKTTYTGKTESVSNVSRADKVQISGIGKDITVAKQAVKNTPDVREDLVASIKERIKNGTYEVSAESFADKMLEKYAEMR
ncbi:MAG: flagellar biosynthesis anti-sigma factor FlgM [Lachnospiraceae bacterium]|jgi:negative regulator of flagellin synthesis FlgM|nr:flagellar biosynthesis anti-sigma factor FlgM [Lachnospiraceae bacterium]